MEKIVILGVSGDQVFEVVVREDVGGFPGPLTIGPFNQDVEWATIIFRTVFGDRFMVENTMAVPAIGIVVVAVFWNPL